MTFTMAPTEILSSPSTRHRRMRTWMPGSLTTSPKSYRSPAGPARVVRVGRHQPRSPSADQFNKQLGNGDDIRQSPKAMAKLKKQVKRTKEILSANTAAPISVESLYNDIDFRSTITREKFEELCEDLWEQALTPIKDVLAQSGMKISDIYAVELIGGATRVPKLHAKLQEFLGWSELDKHLDADEAIVLGASLHVANLSDGIKLNRKLG
ncbi:hypothetical protein ZWY2020_034905 [Hordeum vulgare]|nr:hypothetical protein ZWY2020_034905 [Hordeum vulgare]